MYSQYEQYKKNESILKSFGYIDGVNINRLNLELSPKQKLYNISGCLAVGIPKDNKENNTFVILHSSLISFLLENQVKMRIECDELARTIKSKVKTNSGSKFNYDTLSCYMTDDDRKLYNELENKAKILKLVEEDIKGYKEAIEGILKENDRPVEKWRNQVDIVDIQRWRTVVGLDKMKCLKGYYMGNFFKD